MIALGAIIVLFLLPSCSKKTTEVIHVATDSIEVPAVRSLDVVMSISDSGIIRYKVITAEWLTFTKGARPYQYFPQGIYLERFDSLMVPESTIKADTAYYFEREGLWKLIGNVDIVNMDKDNFTTNLLFWNENRRRIYSDSFISIKKGDRVVEGYGFDSDETMSQYVIRKSQASFPFEENAPSDTLQHSSEQTEDNQ